MAEVFKAADMLQLGQSEFCLRVDRESRKPYGTAPWAGNLSMFLNTAPTSRIITVIKMKDGLEVEEDIVIPQYSSLLIPDTCKHKGYC